MTLDKISAWAQIVTMWAVGCAGVYGMLILLWVAWGMARIVQMKDFRLFGCCLRIFWRGRDCPRRPYFFHSRGAYGFGALCVGFMLWPPSNGEDVLKRKAQRDAKKG